ncbi:MAG: sigma-70 family RNA polymerase sigma factor [Pirellulales bacterium]|nr:sigma-70 family RNA polymerase sigma factor [Pirellulales bacterium]
MTDTQMLDRIAHGDQQAFAAFYDRHAPRVFGLLMRWLRVRVDAEDALQEIFWQVWRSAKQYDPARAAPEAWLVLLARSRSVDLLRRRRRTALPMNPIEAESVDPLARLAFEEATAQVQTALGQLPREQRDAICLAFFDGQTHEQVARNQAVPLGTAKTRILLGMKRLRALLHAEKQVVL